MEDFEGILYDDVAADFHADFIERFYAGMPLASIRAELEADYANHLADEDDMPVVWLALAKAQWDCGHLDPDVLTKVSEIVTSGVDLERWKDEWREYRKQVLEAFLKQISKPNPHPRQLGKGNEEV